MSAAITTPTVSAAPVRVAATAPAVSRHAVSEPR
jgi:hypothetical protein